MRSDNDRQVEALPLVFFFWALVPVWVASGLLALSHGDRERLAGLGEGHSSSLKGTGMVGRSSVSGTVN